MALAGPKNFVTTILKRLAPQLGATLIAEPDFENVGMITFPSGKRVFYRGSRFSVNPSGSVEISIDKNYTTFFLEKFGYQTTSGKTFFSIKLSEKLGTDRNIDNGYQYALLLGFPVIVKPNNFSGGKYVTKVHDRSEFYTAAQQILKETDIFLVEQFYDGNDFRIVVFQDEVIAAYLRVPLLIYGDGRRTVKQLLEAEQTELKKNNGKSLNIADIRIATKLEKLHLDLDSIVPKNQIIQLLDNANLTTGGKLIDLTKQLHASFKDLAVNLTKDMGLQFCGIDIIAEDICRNISNYVIIEINSAPGLIYFANLSKENYLRVEKMYYKILQELAKN